MKSFLFLPLFALLAVSFTSCKKEEITQEVVIPNRTIVTDVAPGDWEDKGSYKRVTINMPEINDVVYENDAILTYFAFGPNYSNYEAIPDVFQGATLTVTHARGFLYIDIQGADGGPVDAPAETIRVKIVIVESGIVD